MTKQIKAIKCPQCGSTRVQEMRTDYYNCENCGTDFFLDSDDITIHHKHEYKGVPSESLSPEAQKVIRFLTLGGAIAFIVAFIFIAVFNCFGVPDGSGYSGMGNGKEEDFSCNAVTGFANKEGKPMLLVFGTTRSGSYPNEKVTVVYKIMDGVSGKEVQRKELPEIVGSRSPEVAARLFENGKMQVLFNEKLWYEFDSHTYTLSAVPATRYQNIPDLSSGFATVEFVYDEYGDGLKVMTNMGKERYYYPLIGKIYDSDAWREAFSAALPAPQERTAFIFSSKSSDYEEEPLRLVRYTYAYQMGYPRYEPRFGWERKPVFWGNETYRKVFISDYSKEKSRLIGYEIINPDSRFFSPGVLWSSADEVLICFRPTAAPDAPYNYQLLDGKTGRLKWSLTAGEDMSGNVRSATQTSEGFLLTYYDSAYLIGNDGKVRHTFKF